MSIKGVMFDMDGLLLDTERVILDCFDATTAHLSLPDMSGVGRQMIGLHAQAGKAVLTDALGKRLSYEEFHEIWNTRVKSTLAKDIPLKTGAMELLQHLAAKGLPCVVATSTRTDVAQWHLNGAGLAQFFHAIIGGDQVTHGKPAPDIYHRAAASIGLEARECVAFEDSDPGATAAIRSGARTVQVPDINDPAQNMYEMGHVIAPTLLEGAQIIGLIPAD